MTRPEVEPLSEQFYDRLPDFMRDADAVDGWQLLRFASLATGAGQPAVTLLDRLDFDPAVLGSTSDLADPRTADAAWLPWLAQLVGVRLAPDASEQARRDAIGSATTGVAAGTRQSIVVAARTALTGSQYVDVRDHEGGDPWTIGVTTKGEETASTAAVLDAIEAARARPVGFRIAYSTYAATWATLATTRPTWAQIEQSVTWTALERTA